MTPNNDLEDSYVRQCIMDEEELTNSARRLAFEVLEKYPDEPVAFVGIYTRGVVFADRLHEIVSRTNPNVTQGTVDITLYRDDLDNLGTIPTVQSSEIPFDVEDSTIILVDDVLFTGRTCRAAIDVIMDYGRPAKIELCVLVDRGNRELPIAPDYTGRFLQTTTDQYVNVRFEETDDREGVYLIREQKTSSEEGDW
jgi:pyrimidine operon attenuation protein/uracil phosphoribosyltransferase